MNREAVFPPIPVDEIMQFLEIDYGRGIARFPVVIERICELFAKYTIPARIIDACGALTAAAASLRISVILASIFSVHVRSLRVRSRRSRQKRAIHVIVGREIPQDQSLRFLREPLIACHTPCP
jgi:hypothetical protein